VLSSSGSKANQRPARILFVDDEPLVLEGLRRSVHKEFSADLAVGPEEGLTRLRSSGPYAVVVSDMRMPHMDGAEFLATVSAIAPDSVRVILTGCGDVETAKRAVNEGRIFQFLTKPVTAGQILVALRDCVAQYHHGRHQKERLAGAVKALEELDVGTLAALARAIDAKSKWTAGHSERVTHVALKIAHSMGLPARDLQILHRGGLLHDIGKIGIPTHLLDKPGRLNPAEMEIMRAHVTIGVRILEPIPCFHEVICLVAQHHEHFDGVGYPAGLAGESISLHARIVAAADAYDAITSDRPYRQRSSPSRALEILRRQSGTKFDPQVIEAFARAADSDQLG
jgi:putative nucleotidyltransferase with HDIG domain